MIPHPGSGTLLNNKTAFGDHTRRRLKHTEYTAYILMVIVMESTGKDIDVLIFYLIDYPVLIIYPSAPESGKIPYQRFGFPDSIITIPAYIIKQFIDPFERFPVFCFPIDIIKPGIIGIIKYMIACCFR